MILQTISYAPLTITYQTYQTFIESLVLYFFKCYNYWDFQMDSSNHNFWKYALREITETSYQGPELPCKI